MARHPDWKVRVLVVWEPILATDWGSPSRSTLSRIPDIRAQQFWDPQRLVAARLNEMAKQNPPQPSPACCLKKGFYWDEAVLYAAHSNWKDVSASSFWNGPVARVAPNLETALGKLE